MFRMTRVNASTAKMEYSSMPIFFFILAPSEKVYRVLDLDGLRKIVERLPDLVDEPPFMGVQTGHELFLAAESVVIVQLVHGQIVAVGIGNAEPYAADFDRPDQIARQHVLDVGGCVGNRPDLRHTELPYSVQESSVHTAEHQRHPKYIYASSPSVGAHEAYHAHP